MSLPTPNSDIISVETFQADCIRRLHSVVMGEIFIHRGFSYYEELLLGICDLFSQINMQGALTTDLLDKYTSLYNNENFRSFWGTVAQNMEYYLAQSDQRDARITFVKNVIGPLRVHPMHVHAPSSTGIALLQQRIIADDSISFENPVDFWIVCLLAFRMTVGGSEVYPFIRKEYAATQEGKTRPAPTKGQTVIPR